MAVKPGATRFVLDAREQAPGFYREQDYELEVPGHMLFNSIPHVKMSKDFRYSAGANKYTCRSGALTAINFLLPGFPNRAGDGAPAT